MFDHLSLFPMTYTDDLDGEEDQVNDRYEVYVNSDFVGIKNLFGRKDTLEDLNRFLEEQGFSKFSYEVNGDHYDVQAEQQVNQVKDALHVHLQSR